MLPIAMICGVVFHTYMEDVAFMAPYLIFVMLLITFCKVDFAHFKITGLTWFLLAFQIVGALCVYLCLLPINEILAQGAFICVFCPTATAAPVITGMLGGSVTRLATFSIISNITVAALAPLCFSLMNGDAVSFISGFVTIAWRVMPMILAPIIVAILLKCFVPRVHKAIATRQSLSFYIWALSLIIVVGRAVSFVLAEPSGFIPLMIGLAVAALAVCLAQFWFGRRVGARFGDKVAGAQGLAQKNTVLAVWMAMAYLNPLSSVAPAAYVAWQNTINSLQIYYKQRRSRR